MLCESTGGDIRACINALQFACLHHDGGNDYNSVFQSAQTTSKDVKVSAKKKAAKNGPKKAEKCQSSIGNKDESLLLLHGLGKILYAKRGGQPESNFLPQHLGESAI